MQIKVYPSQNDNLKEISSLEDLIKQKFYYFKYGIMSGVDIQLLKRLRETTFAPLKDCREALVESN